MTVNLSIVIPDRRSRVWNPVEIGWTLDSRTLATLDSGMTVKEARFWNDGERGSILE